MKRKRLRTHLPAADESANDNAPEKESASVLNASVATQLDVCRCPKCDAPMTARNGPAGPYFHCQCPAKAKARPIESLPVAAEPKQGRAEAMVAPAAQVPDAPESAGILCPVTENDGQ